ncbi:MAG: cytidylate kinase-like family protein [Desulfobacula sp.]|jgi:cytidylate kinase
MAVLTLSWEHQNGCLEIGKTVAEQLNYEFVDRHSITAILKKTGEKWGNLSLELDHERPSLWEQFDREYLGFIALIESTIYDAALRNRTVILGRGSAFILHDIPQALKVRLYAPLNVRIERRMNQTQENYSAAEAFIEKADNGRTGYIQALYGKKLTAVSNYDVVYNTAIQTYDQVIRNLIEILKDWDQRETSENRNRLEKKAVAARVKARILTHPGIFIPTLNVFYDEQAIVIQGVVHKPEQYKLIREIVHETADPHPVRNELHYRQ